MPSAPPDKPSQRVNPLTTTQANASATPTERERAFAFARRSTRAAPQSTRQSAALTLIGGAGGPRRAPGAPLGGRAAPTPKTRPPPTPRAALAGPPGGGPREGRGAEPSAWIVWPVGAPSELSRLRRLAEERRRKTSELPTDRVLRAGVPAFRLATPGELDRGAVPGIFAFPLTVSDRTLAALEFFSDRPAIPDETMAETTLPPPTHLAALLDGNPA